MDMGHYQSIPNKEEDSPAAQDSYERYMDRCVVVRMPFQIEEQTVKWRNNDTGLQEIKRFILGNEAFISDLSHSDLSKGFVKTLQELFVQCKTEARSSESLNTGKPERAILFLICHKDDDDTIQQAVDKCLDESSGYQYKNILLVVRDSRNLSNQEDPLPTASAIEYSSIWTVIDVSFQNTPNYKFETEKSNGLQEIKDVFAKLEKSEYLIDGKRLLRGEKQTPETYSSGSDNGKAHNFDQSHSNISKGFVKKIQEALAQCIAKIKASEIKSLNTVKPERAILFVICHKDDNGTIQQAVGKCLDEIQEDQYENSILVVIHTTETDIMDHFATASADKYKSIGTIIHMLFHNTQDYKPETENSTALQKDVRCVIAVPDLPLEKTCFQRLQKDLEEKNVSLKELHLDKIGTLTDDEKFMLVYMDGPTSHSPIEYYLRYIGKGSTNTRDSRENSESYNEIHSESAIKEKEKEIFITDPSGSRAATQFVEKFQDSMKETGVKIKTFDDSKIALKQDSILILVCNNSSRIEADLNECLRHIQSEQIKQTVVLVLHVGSKGPSDSLKERIGPSDTHIKLDKVLGIVEMTFEIKTGIHTNNFNRKAYERLITLLGKETEKQEKRKKQPGAKGIKN